MNDIFSSDKDITEQKNFFQITNKLKTLITQAKSSGVSAWKAGEMFSEIKNKGIYKIKYTSFETYIKEEFRITDQTANSYIKICENFTLKEIGNLLSSSLTVLADIKNSDTKNKVIKAFVSRKSKDFRVKDIITTVAFIGNENNVDSEEINKIINEVLEESKKLKNTDDSGTKGKSQKTSKTSDKYGESFNDFPREEYKFPIYDFLELKPINEMGVVALFCIIFHEIKHIKFEHNEGVLTFESIRYVQTAFPDINIRCKLHKKRKSNDEFIELKAEFEYKSRNYLEHEHHKSTKAGECKLIICWEDNVRNNNQKKQSDVIQSMPPILELKEFIRTGEITLRF